MSWHPLGPAPEEDSFEDIERPEGDWKTNPESWAEYHAKLDAFWARRDTRREQTELAKDRATLTTQDIMDLLADDLTPALVRVRRKRAEYRAWVETLSTRSLLERYQSNHCRFNLGWSDGYQHDYPDILKAVLDTREHVPNKTESKVLRRLNATKHHGSRTRRESAKAALAEIRQQSPRFKSLQARRREKQSEAVIEAHYARLWRDAVLGRVRHPAFSEPE